MKKRAVIKKKIFHAPPDGIEQYKRIHCVNPNLNAGNRSLSPFVQIIVNTSFSVLLGIWLGIVFAFGLIYWLVGLLWSPVLFTSGMPLDPGMENLLAHVYFSFVAATSIGFGDIVPIGLARILAVIEGAAGLLIFGCMITKLVSNRQEQLVEEIHQITFENRIGRLQTNLHMVLSELQLVSSECKEGDIARKHLISKIESAAMVLSGELRAIHDLLHRPQQNPADAVLVVLLANLVACLSELKYIVDTSDLTSRMSESSMLTEILLTIHSLSNDICADCVAHEYTDELKIWLDLVQEQSSSL